MKPLFNQPDGSTAIQINRASIARVFGLKKSEVGILKVGLDLLNMKILYDTNSQLCFWKGSATGAVVSWETVTGCLNIVSSGGNFSLVQASASHANHLSLDMFYLDKTGKTDVTGKLKEVVDLSNKFGLPIIQKTGIFRISGNTRFNVNPDLMPLWDMAGSTLLPSAGTTGGFYFTNKSAKKEYDSSSSLVSLINANSTTDLAQDTGTIDSLKDNVELNNCMIVFKFTDLAYTYNTTGQSSGAAKRNYYHVSRISTAGKLDHSLPYKATSVESITSIPISNQRCEIGLPNVDLSELVAPFPILFQFFYTTNLEINIGCYFNKPLKVTGNLHAIDVQYSYNTLVRGLYDAHPTVSYTASGGTTASYSLHHGWTCGFTALDCNSNGYGWGAYSSAGWVCDTLVSRCIFNNIDNHDPHIGYFRVEKTTLGDGTITSIGVRNSSYEIEDVIVELGMGVADYYSGGISPNKYFFPGIMTLRTSSGALHDGNLKIRNLRIKGIWKSYDATRDTAGGLVLSASDSFTELPDGAVMTANAFRTVDIEGLIIDNPVTASILSRDIYVHRAGSVYPPAHRKFRNIEYPTGCTFYANSRNFATKLASNSATTNPTYGEVGARIDIDGLTAGALCFIGSTNPSHTINANIRNLRSDAIGSTPPVIRSSQRGIFNISDSEITNIITNDGSNELANTAEFRLSNVIVRNKDALPFVTANTNFIHKLKAVNSIFIGSYSNANVTDANKNLAQWFNLINCSYYDSLGAVIPTLMLWSGSLANASEAVGIYISKGNNVITTSTLNNVVYHDTFNINYATSGVFQRTISTPTASEVNPIKGTTTTNVGGTSYDGTATVKSNQAVQTFAIGTRASQAYITSLFSQLTLTGVHVS